MNKLLVALGLAATVTLVGCSKKAPEDTTPKEQIENAASDAVNATATATDTAVDATTNAATATVDAAKEATTNAATATVDAAKEATATAAGAVEQGAANVKQAAQN